MNKFRHFLYKYLLLFLIINTYKLNAQYVLIPDSNLGYELKLRNSNCIIYNQSTGYLIDTTCSDLQKVIYMDLSYKQLKNLNGIQFFKSLKQFYCTHNQLTRISSLPDSLLELDASYNPILNNDVQLSSAKDLLTLKLTNCNLTKIPALVYNANFSNNNITSIQVNTSGKVKFLVCSYNKINSVQINDDSLLKLIIDHNIDTSTINSWYISPSCKMIYLDFSFCNIKNIRKMTLPSNLEQFYCNDNLLDSLPELPASLKTFDCSNNRIYSLPKLPSDLSSLNCSKNNIDTLPNPLPAALWNFDCSYNLITNLPPLPRTLTQLSISNNSLMCLPQLNSIYYLFKFADNHIKCLPNQVQAKYCDQNLSIFPICGRNDLCDYYYQITGNVHKFNGADCMEDSLSTKLGASNVKVILYDSTFKILEQTITNKFGNYTFSAEKYKTFFIAVDTLNLPFKVQCPANNIYNVFLTDSDILVNRDFALGCLSYIDYGVQNIYTDRLRPATNSDIRIELSGFSNTIKERYNFNCNSNNIFGTLNVYLPQNISYISTNGNLSPNISSKVLSYDMINLDSVSLNGITINVKTDSNAQNNEVQHIAAAIKLNFQDRNPSDDSLNMSFLISNSHDPNEKEVSPLKIPPLGGWLTYTIRFQNTGNDTAYLVAIKDTLDQYLNLSSIQYLSSSHHCRFFVDDRILHITFPEINLLDSNHNEPLSHGWFQFKIKVLDSIPSNIIIENRAAIYFDFNQPVITNTALSNNFNLGSFSSINNKSHFTIFPNPASSQLNISGLNAEEYFYQISDILGRKVSNLKSLNTSQIDVSSLNDGVYFLQIYKAGCSFKTIKFIKENNIR